LASRAACGLLLASMTLVTASCVGGSGRSTVGGAEGLSFVGGGELPSPGRADYSAAEMPFTLGPYDVVDIEVFANEDLRARDIEVDPSGRITFPLVGTIEVGGKTPGEAAKVIEAGLRQQYFRDPRVSINVKKAASQVVSISGEIRKPGIYPIVGDMTLLKAIARAEGWTEFSKKREVIVFREVDNKRYAALYDVKAIERGQYPDPRLFPNDTVVVGDSQARRNMKDILTAAPPVIAPLIFLLDSN
jgi:polysaccharide biosynthesis/export protein